MAQRRMFSLKVIDTDTFLDMPQGSQLLYFHLAMRADDDGFVSSPKKIMRTIGCRDDDMKILQAKQFVIPFESGICVIKHWRIHNLIRWDRYNPTLYDKEKSVLDDNNGSYEIIAETQQNSLTLSGSETKWQPNGNQMATQDRLGKDRLGKDKEQLVQKCEEIWKLYPNKKGKQKAINKLPTLINKYGDEQIKKCVKRYIKYVNYRRNTDFKNLKYQNGSTFFNGTYVDYLDENYQGGIDSEQSKSSDANSDYSEYDESAITI